MRKSITKRAVDALKLGQIIADDELPGFVVRRLPSGKLSYGYRYTTEGRRRWLAIGMGIPPDVARKAAVIHAGQVALDKNPVTKREDRRRRALEARTINQVLDAFLKERVEGRQLRSRSEMASLLERYVRPKLGDRLINEIKRSEVVAVLDDIADRPSSRSRDGKSRRVADKVLGVLRSAFNWHATRDDEFRTPIVQGMARTSLKELTRDRILSDDEIRVLWRALDDCQPAAYRRLVRVLLLSAARLNEMARLLHDEIEGEEITVPASRCKTKVDHVLPITPTMAALIGEGGEDAGDYVFSTDGGFSPFSGFSKAKRRLDALINGQRKSDGLKPLPGWRLHDLRRTARSLMSRAGVSTDIAERVLGHVMPGVRGVYDRHAYLAEKRHALERLGALLDTILTPPTNNVVSIGRRQ
jgi:integrase